MVQRGRLPKNFERDYGGLGLFEYNRDCLDRPFDLPIHKPNRRRKSVRTKSRRNRSRQPTPDSEPLDLE